VRVALRWMVAAYFILATFNAIEGNLDLAIYYALGAILFVLMEIADSVKR